MDGELKKVGLMIAREIETLQKFQAGKVFPRSRRLVQSIRVTPVETAGGFRFVTDSVSYGKYQDLGTLGRRAKSRKPFNESPQRKRPGQRWNPSGITPSFWGSVMGKDRERIMMMLKKAMTNYAKSLLPKRITIKVR